MKTIDPTAAMLKRRVFLVVLGWLTLGLVLFAWYFHHSHVTSSSIQFTVTDERGRVIRCEAILNGESFESGKVCGIGRKKLTLRAPGYEDFETNLSVGYWGKSLGTIPLESSKGSLSVTVEPSPAVVILQQADGTVVHQADAPIKISKLPVGNYSLLIRRSTYEETKPVIIERNRATESTIVLNLGGARLSSEPADAEFELSGNGKQWQGKLPTEIPEMPAGAYQFIARRKGWEQRADITVNQGRTATNTIEFPYGSIEATSEPSGLAVSLNGVEMGKTPTILREVKPGDYHLVVVDGENSLETDVTVAAKEAATRKFTFSYGTVKFESIPSGATVVRGGIEVGKTPLTLNRFPVEGSTVEIRLDGYALTNVSVSVTAGGTTNLAIKLLSSKFLSAMTDARQAFDAGRFAESQKAVAVALGLEPNDSGAVRLRDEVFTAIARVEEEQKELARRAVEQRKAEERDAILAIIEKAIRATGGRAVLNRFQAVRSSWDYSGTDLKGNSFTMRSQEYVQSPDKIRLDQTITYLQSTKSTKILGALLSLESPAREVRQTVCLTGSGSWVTDAGILGAFKKLSKDGEEGLRSGLYKSHLRRLLPLFDKKFTLSKAENATQAPANSIGISVRAEGHPDVIMFFDRSTSLLTAIDSVAQRNGRTSHSTLYLSRYIDALGLLYPSVMESKQDGVLISTGTAIQITPCETIPSDMFARPNQ